MKTIIFLSLAVFIILMAATSKVLHSERNNLSIVSDFIPDSVMKVFYRSCTDCHSIEGNMMAKAHLNFSEWKTYSFDKKTSLAQSICARLRKGTMPPQGWKKNNPDRIPTYEEINAICNWAK